MGITVLSLFDGMSGGQEAFKRLGITFDGKENKYFASEIKAHAIKCVNSNYSNTIQIGDVTKVNYKDGVLYTEKGEFNVGSVDYLIGGSPCQDFSSANRIISGLEGSKSSLFYHYYRILKEVNPKYFLLENVKMKKEHEEQLNSFMGVNPILIDSSLVSGALRKRNYWTNIENIQQPIDLKINLNDIIEEGYCNKSKANCLMEGDSRPLVTPVKIFHRYFAKSFNTAIFKDERHFEECKKHYLENFPNKRASDIDGFKGDLSIYNGIRYLNKRERCKLQGFPEHYCDKLSENDSASLLGDGWTVDVIAHILKNSL